MSSALEMTRVGKRYKRAWALHDCSVNVPAGRVTALVGPNGAGKTTLLNLIAGLVRPTQGTLRMFGTLVPGSSPALPVVGYLAQHAPLYGSFTVRDTLSLGRRLNPTWDEGWARQRLRRLEIPFRRPVGKLSGGQKAHVALILALAKRPRLLLLDEPLASLDPVARHELSRTLMESVAEREMTVILSSHIVSELNLMCDWLIAVNGGRVQISGEIDQLLTGHKILSGPPEVANTLHDRLSVVSRTDSERQTTALVRLDRQAIDPRWSVHDPNLEELVLAYLRQPRNSLLPGPTAVSS